MSRKYQLTSFHGVPFGRTPPTKKRFLSTDKRRFFERCLPCRANDACFAHDAAFGNDVCLRAHRANIYEANYAQGKKDFISKLKIALKEASEPGYWLELLHRTGCIDDPVFNSLSDQCTAIRVMLVASCRTAKQNQPVT